MCQDITGQVSWPVLALLSLACAKVHKATSTPGPSTPATDGQVTTAPATATSGTQVFLDEVLQLSLRKVHGISPSVFAMMIDAFLVSHMY